MRRLRFSPGTAWPRGRLGRVLDILLAFSILAFIAIIWMNVDRVAMRQFAGVAEAVDGDSLRLAGERIRLSGIDAPELGQTCRRDGEDYGCGREALKLLSRLVADLTVICGGWERDRYGRRLAVCRADGMDINRALVEQGWAVAYGGYEDAEAAARQARRGVWAGDFERPSDWRKVHGGLAETEHDVPGAVINWLRQVFAFS